MKLIHSTVAAKFAIPSLEPVQTEFGKGYTFSGHGAAWAKDLGGNVLEKGAFLPSIEQRIPNRMIKVRWLHYDPMGFVTSAKEDDIGLYIEAFVPATPSNAERIALMQGGVVDKMSIGFDPDYKSITYSADERHIPKLTLYEVSPVDLPLNEGTDVDGITALGLSSSRIFVMNGRTIIKPKKIMKVNPAVDMPCADLTAEWDAVAALGRVKGFYNVTDTPTAEFDACFIWVPDNDNTVSARSLLVVDIMGAQNPDGSVGAPVIVPAGVEEAANTIDAGASDQTILDPLGIPATEVDNCKATIDAYYAIMQAAFSDPTLVSPWNTSTQENETPIESQNKPKASFKGAVLNSTNMQLLKDAQKAINTVINSATVSESQDELIPPAIDAFSKMDWSDTLQFFESLKQPTI